MQRTKRQFRVAAGLIGAWTVLAIILMCWQIWAAHRHERALALAQTEQRAGQLAVAAAEHVATFTQAIDFTLLELRDEYGIGGAHFRATVALLMKSFPEESILEFNVANANGELTYSNLGLAHAVSIGDREHFIAHVDGADRLYIGKPVFGRVSKKWSIQFTRPVLRDGRFAGVVAVSVAPEYLGKGLALLGVHPGDNASLFLNDGAYLARDRMLNEVMGKSVPPSPPFLAADAPGRGVFRAHAYADNIDRIFGWARVPGTSLITTVGLNFDAALGPLERQFRQSWINVGIFALILVALGIVILLLLIHLARRQRAFAASEARFRNLTERSSDWYWEQDENYRFTRMSSRVGRADDIPAQELIGKTRWELGSERGPEEALAAHRKVLDAHLPYRNFEYSVVHKGSRFHFSVSGMPLFDDQGRFTGYRGVGSNITKRKQSEDSLRESEQRFRDLTELSTDWYWEQDASLRFSFLSQGVERKTGLVPTTVLGKLRWELPITSVSEEQWQAHRAMLARREPFHDFVYEIMYDNGDRRWFSVSGKPIFGVDGQFLGYRGIGHDITERVHAERAQSESEARLREAQRMARLGSWEWDLINDERAWSDEVFRILEIDPERSGVSSEAFFAATHPDDRDAVTKAYARSVREHTLYEMTYRLLMADGRIKYVHDHGETVYDQHGRPLRSVGTVQDISEQKQVEAELRDSAYRLQDLSRRLAQIQENERRQVAGELHDSMGRDLTALAIDLDIIRTQLPAHALADVEAKLDDARALVGAAMQNVRSVVAGLRPPLLEEWGLLPALRWHAVEFSKHAAIAVAVAATGDEARLPKEVEMALFRVAQEALLNCAKHARASRIDIGVEAFPGRTVLTVTDDGIGFIVEHLLLAPTVPRLGIALMRERIDAVGGTLYVVSSLGTGTRVTAEIRS